MRIYTRKPLAERFWAKVNKSGPIPKHCPELGNCWEWTASQNGFGYGQFVENQGESPKGAHRVSWEINKGEIPSKMMVLHRCDNPQCVNPSHLFLGTNRDNVCDAISKGRKRQPIQFGIQNSQAKYSEAQIRKLKKFGILPKGMSANYASEILRGIRWGHIQ